MKIQLLLPLSCLPLIGGCAAAGALATAGQLAAVAMDVAGLRKQTASEAATEKKNVRRVALELHAGNRLNAGSSSQPASLVVRLYALRHSDNFSRAPYGSFLDPVQERVMLGTELIQVREVLLLPTQQLHLIEELPGEATHFGVVALFREPAAKRWKVVFSASEAEAQGVIVAAQACLLSIGQGASPEPSGGAPWSAGSPSCS